MTLKSVTEGTQPKKLQTPSQPIMPQPRPVAEVCVHVYVHLLMQSVLLLLLVDSHFTFFH